MNSAVESLLQSSVRDNKIDKIKADSIEDSIEIITQYIETQLPKVVEVEFAPVCFDLTQDEKRLIMGGFHGNLAIFDLVLEKVSKDIELCASPINSVTFCLGDSIVLVINEQKNLYILDFPSFNLVYTSELVTSDDVPTGEPIAAIPMRFVIKTGFLKESVFVSTMSNSVSVFDLKPFEEVCENRGGLDRREIVTDGVVCCLDVSDDGCLLAFGFCEGFLRLYHGETESQLQQTATYAAGLEIIAFGQNRKLVSAGFCDFSVVVWNIDSTLTVKSIILMHTQAIKGLTFIKDNRYLITGGDDTKIIVHDMKIDRSPYFLELFDQKVLCFKASNNREKLFFSQNMNKLMVWEVPLLSKNVRYRRHEDKVIKILFIDKKSRNNKKERLLSIGKDGLAIIWDYCSDIALEVIEVGSELTTGIVSSDSEFVFLCSTKPSLVRWSLANYKYYDYDLNSTVRSIRFSSDENLLALGDDLYRIIVYDAVIMERKYIIKGHTDVVTEIYFIKYDTEVISSSRDCSLGTWDLNTSDRKFNFHGHRAPVNCMIVTNDEAWVVSGAEDSTIIIWSINNILMHTLRLDSSIHSLYLSKKKKYLISVEENMMSYWQMDNLNRVFQLNLGGAGCLAVSKDEKIFAVAEGNTIFVEENPLKSDKIRVVGNSYGSPHKFMSYILEIIKYGNRPKHLDIYNQWLFTPYCIGVAHILAYSNRYDTLYPVLLESEKRPPFCSALSGETPISISVEKDHKGCIEICLKYMKIDHMQGNKRAYVPLSSCLTRLNTLEITHIPRLYEILYERSFSNHLPNFCVYGTALPALYHSKDFLIDTSNLIPDENVSTHGLSIVFYHTLCPMSLNIGSNNSIEFLESLLVCPYTEIFRTKLLQEILESKWQSLKWAIYIQGIMYIFYLIQLSFFCIFFRGSPTYLITLFIVHVLLFLYEIIQVITDFSDYWLDLWNILDQLRGISFSIYCVLEWNGRSDDTVLLIVIIFSWTRGISYFRMFDGTRYMVRLLSEVIKDMKFFFILLFYSTIAFAFIFYLRNRDMCYNDPVCEIDLSQYNTNISFSEYLTISYRLNLGEFDTSLPLLFDWIIFILATVINPLIMMNLLISIMADTYAKVQETNDIANYQELTEMVIEIEKLMFWKKEDEDKFYMHQCDFLKNNELEKDKVCDKIKAIKTEVERVEGCVSALRMNVKNCNMDDLYEVAKNLSNEDAEMEILVQENQETISEMHELLKVINRGLEDEI